jgi:hypothetical protein
VQSAWSLCNTSHITDISKEPHIFIKKYIHIHWTIDLHTKDRLPRSYIAGCDSLSANLLTLPSPHCVELSLPPSSSKFKGEYWIYSIVKTTLLLWPLTRLPSSTTPFQRFQFGCCICICVHWEYICSNEKRKEKENSSKMAPDNANYISTSTLLLLLMFTMCTCF